jgi:hypothetical protein
VIKVTREDQCDYGSETHCEREGQGQNKCENKCDIDGENDTENEDKNEDHYGDDCQCNREGEDQGNHEDEDQSYSKNHEQVTMTHQPPTPTLRIPAAPFIAGVGLLPLGAFVICVLVTFIKDYHESTVAICPFDKVSEAQIRLYTVDYDMYLYTYNNTMFVNGPCPDSQLPAHSVCSYRPHVTSALLLACVHGAAAGAASVR